MSMQKENVTLNNEDLAILPHNVTANESCSFNLTNCCGACGNSTSGVVAEAIDFDAFAYIIVVLSFYAISMVLLMIKYIRREEEEISLDYYYAEFVKRDKFQNPVFKNKVALQNAASSGLIDKAFNVLTWDDKFILTKYKHILSNDHEEKSLGFNSSASCDPGTGSDQSSEVKVDSSDMDDEDLISEQNPSENLLETVV